MPDIYVTNREGVVIQKDLRTESQKIDTILAKSEPVLFEASAVFPFDLFPDRLIIHPDKVSLIYHIFFFSEQVFPMFIRDLKNVAVGTNVLFGSLLFELQGFEKNPPKLNYLKVSEAIKARRIITGLIAFNNERIDVTKLSTEELAEKAEEVGKARNET